MSLFSELKRRNVFRVAVAYLAAAWLLTEVAGTVFPLFGFGDAPARIVVILLAIGFPLFLIFSWLFEITPEGLKREVEANREESITRYAGKRIDRMVVALLALALGYFAIDKFVLDPLRDAELVEETAQQARSDALVESYGDKSIAVLPFLNMSSDPEQEYFSDGISEELLNLLTRMPELRVISRSSSFSFKGKDIPLPEVARQLNVEHLLEGSVRKSGDRVRITVQLIDARSDTHLWSEVYERELGDIFAIQGEIATAIGSALKFQLIKGGTAPLQPLAVATTNTAAFEAYLKGRYHLNKWNTGGFEKALEYFQQALEQDPSYSLAYAGLAESYSWLGLWNALPANEAYPKAKAVVSKALELDDALAEAHTTLADVKFFYDWNWDGAEKEYKRAIELNPSYAIAHNNYAFCLIALTRHDEALAEIELARQLDPISLVVNSDLGWAYYLSRQYDQAAQQFQRALELDPNLMIAHVALGQIYEQKHMLGKSMAAFEQAVSLAPDDPEAIIGLGRAYAVAGRREDALKIVARLTQQSQQNSIPSWGIATIYIGLDNKDEAIAWLEKAFADRLSVLVYIQTDPMLDPIRSDPRFQVLVRRMGFPE
jgi:TolB-like protein/Flp pilus assembly protein TadD